MKKIIFITLAIIICIIGTTGILVNKLKTDLEKDNIGMTIVEKNDFVVSGNADEIIEKPEIPKEKTLNLYGTYDQNDLLIVDKEIEHELIMGGFFTLKQISGLKDKNVENKINADIEEKFLKTIEETSELYDDDALYAGYYYGSMVSANFSNVLSIAGYVVANNKDGERIDVHINLNYNLVNGEEIKFRDLFTQDADIQTMLRAALYRKNEEIRVIRESWDEVYQGQQELTEDEINKVIKNFNDGEEFVFSFTPYEINIHAPKECSIKFEDFADMVTIYDKYLTDESLYEKENIGLKDIVTCSRESFYKDDLYKKTSYEGKNLFYDITINDNIYYDDQDILKETTRSKLNECLSNVNKKIEEYEVLAQNNPNQMYIVFFRPIITMGTGYSNTYYNLISINYYEKVVSGDISEKDELLYKLYSLYRYPNLDTDMYGGQMYSAINSVLHEEYRFDSVEENTEFVVYDTLTGNKITDLKDIFKDDVDYVEIIGNVLKKDYLYKIDDYYDGEKWVDRTTEEIEKIILEAEYRFDAKYIYPIIDGKDDEIGLNFYENRIWPYTKLQKFTY